MRFAFWLWLAFAYYVMFPAAAFAQQPTAGADPTRIQDAARAVATELAPGLLDAAAKAGKLLAVAVRPIRPDETDLPLDLTARLTDAIEAALAETIRDRLRIIARTDFNRVWDEVYDFGNGDLSGLLQRNGADLLVHGRISTGGTGISLAYKATDVRRDRASHHIDFTGKPIRLEIDPAALTTRDFEQALTHSAQVIADRLAGTADFARAEVQFEPTGAMTQFTEHALRRLSALLLEIMPVVQRQRAGPQPVTDQRTAPASRAVVRLRATAIDDGERVNLDIAAETAGGKLLSGPLARIAKSSLPPQFRVIDPSDSGVFRASGEAVVAGVFDRLAAERAARSLARARVLVQARRNGVEALPINVGDTADAARVLGSIRGGITHDERWTMTTQESGRVVRAELSARVTRFDGDAAPHLRTTLSAGVIPAMASFSLDISSARSARIAVFGWNSDDTLIRLYPFGEEREINVKAGTLRLPRNGEQPFMAAPRPGLPEDFEALVVIASREALDYDRLAGEAGQTVEETLAASRPAEQFFEALAVEARRSGGGLAIEVLPYLVRK